MKRQRPKIGQQKQTQDVQIPMKCPQCNEKGLVLAYDYGSHEMTLICEMREDAHGRFIEGCHKTVFQHSLTEREYHALCHEPLMRDNFFILEVMV